MKKYILFMGVALALVSLSLWISSSEARALPEYAAQTGEPCSSCHISPSGGGTRGARGQAWVASNKPAVVPDLMQSLEILGVELTVDPAYYSDVAGERVEAEPPDTNLPQEPNLFRWLSDYDGN